MQLSRPSNYSALSRYGAVSAASDACVVPPQDVPRLDAKFCWSTGSEGGGGVSSSGGGGISSSSSSGGGVTRSCVARLMLIGASKAASSTLAAQLAANRGVHIACPVGAAHRLRRHSNGSVVIYEEECAGSGAGREVHLYDGVERGHGDATEYAKRERQIAAAVTQRLGAPAGAVGFGAVVHYTPHYLYDPAVPTRMRASFGHLGGSLPALLRFVVILREPVSRAISSFWFKGGRSVPQGEAMLTMQMDDVRRAERCVAQGGGSAMTCGADGRGAAFSTTDHVGKGVYAPQLRRWFDTFGGACHFFVTTLERLYMRGKEATSAQLRALLRWAGVAGVSPSATLGEAEMRLALADRRLTGNNPHEAPFSSGFRERLGAFYAPYNRQLAALIGHAVLQDWATAYKGGIGSRRRRRLSATFIRNHSFT